MRRPIPRTLPGRRRPGQTLILFALLLPLVLGMLGLIIDSGLLMATQRQAQNAADAAAMAAAMDRFRGLSVGTAIATATTYVTNSQYNNLPGATVAVSIPPGSGPYAGDSACIEAIVTVPLRTMFIQALGVNPNQQIQARAVACVEGTDIGAGAIALDPKARPGLSVQGTSSLIVSGNVVVNSEAAGLDQNNQGVDLGLQPYAVTTSNNATVKARNVLVVGGVDVPANYRPYVTGDPGPLHAGVLPFPDPLKNVPVPVNGMPGVDPTPRGSFQASYGTHTLNPGVYDSIKISGNNTKVTFNPGVYILKISDNGDNALTITGGGTIRGTGVMFYNTGSDFNVNTGLPDISDGENSPPAPSNANFGDVTINASDTDLKGINDPSSAFDGLLFYQRRRNTKGADIQGNGTNNKLEGTFYAKWADFKITGSGTYSAQFVVGTMTVGGNANMTFDTHDKQVARPLQVFLVE